MLINQHEFKLHDKLFDRISIEKFVISHKLLFNGYFEAPLSDIYQDYWEYAKTNNIVGQSLSKNLNTYFNLRLFRDFDAYCYNIKEIDIYELNKAIQIEFNDYKNLNKYSSLKGFKENNKCYKLLLSTIKKIKDGSNDMKQIDDNDDLKIYIDTKTSLINLYSSKLNLIEISEYANFIYNEISNFDPDKKNIKHPFKDDNTFNLFNYIVNNWNYNPDIKWAYIYNFLNDPKINGNEYERYVRETQNFKGLFNYNNANSQKVYDALDKLKKSFIENYR